ncbi:SDR family NAD(P)-dependent oxidoreductase [Antricoccus suffuscus]|nr:SDR family NAD(P)-dependent oxidoreductase [Antricoccus suffuscus]
MTTSTANKTTVLITGANRGLGRETARRLGALGWTVWLGARDAEQAAAVAAELSRHNADVRPIQLDVTDDASVEAAAKSVAAEHDHLDVLVNNAGIPGGWIQTEEVTPADFLPVYGVNVLGPVRMTRAFLPLLRASSQPRIVMVSSGMGSFGITTDSDRFESTLKSLVYTSSKAALNMITSQYAKALDGVQVNAVDPGYTDTEFNDHRGTQTVREGTDAIVTLATADPDGPTGGYFDRSGPIPW